MKNKAEKEYGAKDFRAELAKIMPGYDWTVHKSCVAGYLEATGTQSSGFNRLSTLNVERRESDKEWNGNVSYIARSAGNGTKAKWGHVNRDGTLARALRGLQDHYEWLASHNRSLAASLERGRKKSGDVNG